MKSRDIITYVFLFSFLVSVPFTLSSFDKKVAYSGDKVPSNTWKKANSFTWRLIKSINGHQTGRCTAFSINKRGKSFILTAAHCVGSNADESKFWIHRENRWIRLTLLETGYDVNDRVFSKKGGQDDWALFLPSEHITGFPYDRTSRNIDVGDYVLSVQYQNGFRLFGEGVVADRKIKTRQFKNLISCSIPVASGTSGSPVFKRNLGIIGMTIAQGSQGRYSNVMFVIPIQNILDQSDIL